MKTSKISEQYSTEDLAESFVFPIKVTDAQKKRDSLAISQHRKEMLEKMPPARKLLFKLLQLKFQMEDYIKRSSYDNNLTFGHFLREYVNALDKKMKDFAKDVSIEPAELSQIINQHRMPKVEMIIRLEIHSNKAIPAIIWYKLLEKEKEHELFHNQKQWALERKYVKNKLQVQFK